MALIVLNIYLSDPISTLIISIEQPPEEIFLVLHNPSIHLKLNLLPHLTNNLKNNPFYFRHGNFQLRYQCISIIMLIRVISRQCFYSNLPDFLFGNDWNLYFLWLVYFLEGCWWLVGMDVVALELEHYNNIIYYSGFDIDIGGCILIKFIVVIGIVGK